MQYAQIIYIKSESFYLWIGSNYLFLCNFRICSFKGKEIDYGSKRVEI